MARDIGALMDVDVTFDRKIKTAAGCIPLLLYETIEYQLSFFAKRCAVLSKEQDPWSGYKAIRDDR